MLPPGTLFDTETSGLYDESPTVLRLDTLSDTWVRLECHKVNSKSDDKGESTMNRCENNPAPEPPPGFRFVTIDDVQNPEMPNGTIQWSNLANEWLCRVGRRRWMAGETYAIPVIPIPEGWRPVLPEEQAKTKKPILVGTSRSSKWNVHCDDGKWYSGVAYIVPTGTALEPLDAPAPAECAECARLRQQVVDHRAGQEALRLDLERVCRERDEARAEVAELRKRVSGLQAGQESLRANLSRERAIVDALVALTNAMAAINDAAKAQENDDGKGA